MQRPAVTRASRAALASCAIHAVVAGALLLVLKQRPSPLAPLRLPGTPSGHHLLLSYSTGGSPSEAISGIPRSRAPRKVAQVPYPRPAPPQAAPALALATESGSGSAGQSALGDDNVRIALPQLHPRPSPDLSTLPHGTAGDVIVDVVIDQGGRVTDTTLVKGLGETVDHFVMEALRGWTFTPATRNGTPIRSEQEILIHYERS